MGVDNINNGCNWQKCGAAMAVPAAPVPMALPGQEKHFGISLCVIVHKIQLSVQTWSKG